MKILFVCSGNICRSPMAEAYMRHRAARGGLTHASVESAGTLNINGAPASDEAIRTVRQYGIDLTAHRSRGLTERMLRETDLVVVMTDRHREEVTSRLSGSHGVAIHLIRAFEVAPTPADDPLDLDDPIGLPEEFYRGTFDTIRTCVDHLVMHLRHGS
jgi:protein-tyrosine-phosphatase